MAHVTYDRSKLQKLGERRRALLDELEQIRRAVTAEVPLARDGEVTWREISYLTTYTEQQLRTMTLPEDEKEARDEQRRKRRRKTRGERDDRRERNENDR
jgi:hypothetical protein